MTLIDLALPYQRRVLESKAKCKVLNFGRQEGKSWVAAFSAVKKACSKPNQLIIYLSTGQRAADEALKTCLKFCEAVKCMTGGKMNYSTNATCISFINGSRIMSLPSSPAACRGFQVSLLLLDEIGFWEHADEVWTAVIPTLTNKLANPDKELIVCSTPSGKNNIFFEICQKAKNTEGWEYFETNIEEAVAQGLKADISELRKLIPDPIRFNQEFMCQFSDQTNSLLDVSLVQTFDENEDKNVQYFMGVDFGRTHDATGIIVLKRDKAGKIYLVDAIKLNNVEYQKQFNVIRETFLKYRPKCCFCDAGGLGGPLAEELNRQVSALIKGIQFTAQNKAEMYEYLRKVVFDRQFFVQSGFAKQIKQELQMVRQIISESGKTTYSADRSSDSHADLISALILALHAERNNKQSSAMPTSASLFSAFGSRHSRL